MSDASSDHSSASSAEKVDHFEDVFVHHLAEIEQVWHELNVARAKSLKVRRDPKRPDGFRIKYPIKLSAIQNLAYQELQDMKDNEEGIDGTAEGVADGLDKEAGVLLSFMGAMFIENLMIKTMYYLPPEKSLGFRRPERPLVPQPTQLSNDPSSLQLPNITSPASTANLSQVLDSYSLEVTREDVRRALLRDEMCDFLVQSGLAQPEVDAGSIVAEIDEENSKEKPSTQNRLHLGFWKVLERTFSGLEMGSASSVAEASSSASSDLQATTSHRLSSLTSKLMMRLTPEADSSHARFTIFPDNEDLESNQVEFSLEIIPGDETHLRLGGRVRMAQVDIVALEGKISANFAASGDLGSSPMNFSWKEQNEQDAAFPLVGRRTGASGRGSVQLMDKATALENFPTSASWISSSPYGILSLDLLFQLGDTGFILHNHYLCIPIFVQPPPLSIPDMRHSTSRPADQELDGLDSDDEDDAEDQ